MLKKACGCQTLDTGLEYINPYCGLHGEPCDCEGCGFCNGKQRGCTCHVDWEKVYNHDT